MERKYKTEHIEFCVNLWKMEISSGEIARRFSAKYGMPVTRNTIIGLIHRNTNHKHTAPSVKGRPTTKVRRAPPIVKVPQLAVVRYTPEPRYERISTCQYFIGDKMCGVKSHGSWCDEHKEVVYVRDGNKTKQEDTPYNPQRRNFRIQGFR